MPRGLWTIVVLLGATTPALTQLPPEIGVSGREWERVLQGMAQPLMSKINEFWNRSLVRRLDFQVVDPWPDEDIEANTSSERQDPSHSTRSRLGLWEQRTRALRGDPTPSQSCL